MRPDGTQRSRFPLSASQVALALGLLLLPLVYWVGLQYPYQTPKLLVFRGAVLVILLSTAVRLLSNNARPRVRLVDAALLTFLAWMAITSSLSAWPLSSLLGIAPRYEGWVGFVGYAAVYWVTSRSSPKYLHLLGVATVLVGGVVGGLAILDTLVWYSPPGQGHFGLRAVATFGNPIYVGALFTVAIPITLGLLLLSPRRVRVLYLGAFALQAAGLYCTFGRGAWIGCFAGALVFALGLQRIKGRARQCLVYGALVVGVTTASLGAVIALRPNEDNATAAQQAIEAVNVQGGSAATRLLMWKTTLSMIVERPIGGWGLDTFAAEFPSKRSFSQVEIEGPEAYSDRPHNHWLYLVYAGGPPALLLYVGYLALIILRAVGVLGASHDEGRKIAVAALLGAVVGYEIQSLFSFTVPETAPFAFAAQGAVVALTASTLGRRPGLRRIPWREWTVPRILGIVAGILCLLLSLPFMLDGVRQPWADHVYSSSRDAQRRIADLSRAATLAPRDPLFALGLGRSLSEARSFAAAERAYLRGQQSKPWDPGLDYYRATDYEIQGRVEEATQVYRQILERDPYHVGALYQLGNIERSGGDYSEAAALLERLTRAEPTNAGDWYALGQAYEGLGNDVGAVRAYQRVLALSPGDINARERLSKLQQRGD